ncbi:hypothetical protein Hanom_Chr13g01228281 [Helianthus anomalus]
MFNNIILPSKIKPKIHVETHTDVDLLHKTCVGVSMSHVPSIKDRKSTQLQIFA